MLPVELLKTHKTTVLIILISLAERQKIATEIFTFGGIIHGNFLSRIYHTTILAKSLWNDT